MDTTAYAEHEAKKVELAQQLIKITRRQAGNIALQKNTSNLFRNRDVNNNKKIDVRSFNKVLNIDLENFTADVEGMTTYETLVAECLHYFCLPAIVPELKSITVGGALAGGAIESSSFRYGLVHESILEFDVLLSDGRIITCTPTNEHRDLFYGFPNTYGTLGYALRIKLKLIPTKKYVRITHQHFNNPSQYFEAINNTCHENKNGGPINYIDGVIFDNNNFYLTTGEFVDHAPHLSNYKYLNIYYQSIKTQKTDYLTTLDYIWRWDSDWFWCSKFFFMQNKLMRLLFGKWVLKSTAFWKIRNFVNRNKLGQKLVAKMQQNTEAVIQDVQIPITNAVEFLNFFQENIKITPIWICPTMAYTEDTHFTFYPMTPNTVYINYGFWDIVPSIEPAGHYNQLVEQKVRQLNGYKGLYSNIFYSEPEFWAIYNQPTYNQLKQSYDPLNKFKNLYQKCIEK